MFKYLKIPLIALVFLFVFTASMFAFGRDTALANFVVNSWQGYKLTSGLVGYWSFDGQDMDLASSTREVFDRSGQGNNGDWKEHATTTVIGKIGQGISFDGVNDLIRIPASSSLNGLTALTACAWVKPINDALSYPVVFSTYNSPQTSGWDLYLTVGDSSGRGLGTSYQGGGNGYIETFTSIVKFSVWTHICAIQSGDANTNMHFYVNGAEVSYGSYSTGIRASDVGNGAQVGDDANNNNPFNGSLDEVRIYNRVLSADEIKRLYLMGASTKINVSHRDELTANEQGTYLTFDGKDMDLSSSTAEVRGINGEGGAFGTSGDWKNHATTTTIGKIGQAIQFDGVDDLVDFGDQAAYDIGDTEALTISGWFYRDTQTTADALMFKRQGLLAAYPGYGAYITAVSDQINFEVSDGTDEYSLDSVTTFKNPGWYHFAIVWDPNSAANTEIYINGVDDNAADTGTIANIGDLSTTYGLVIGAQSDGNSPFVGKLDEIRLYRRVLSPDEIKRLYLMGRGQKLGLCGPGGILDADGNSYGIVQIGTQCWLDRNMNVGTRINDGTAQTDNATIEKYCYNNLAAYCDNNHPNKPDGGLYQWDEAMQYVTTEGAQGICPAGWHIPTDAEFHTLEEYLKNDGEICASGRLAAQCPPSGTKLKSGGSSSFEGNLAGDVDTGTSLNRDTHGYFWSSSSTASVFSRYVTASASTTGRTSVPKDNGFSLRCIKDES